VREDRHCFWKTTLLVWRVVVRIQKGKKREEMQ
jgi:hypothetical protein